MHSLLLDPLYQACQHYLPTYHHIHQYTKLPLEQGIPETLKHTSNLGISDMQAQMLKIIGIFLLGIYPINKKNLFTCSAEVWNALYNARTVYPWRSEALLITTIRACHTSSFTKFPAY